MLPVCPCGPVSPDALQQKAPAVQVSEEPGHPELAGDTCPPLRDHAPAASTEAFATSTSTK